ncbi:hypothetical protein JOM56_015079 [Amanita muscaria]
MNSLSNLLCILGIFGVAGLVWALKVIGLTNLTRIAGSFWFRPLAPRQVIANEHQDCTDNQFTGDPTHAGATPATGSTSSPGEGPTSTGIITIQTQETERLNARLEELCTLVQALVSEVARLNHLVGRITGPLQSGEMLLQQCNDKVDDIARKTIDIHQIISQRAGSKDIEPLEPEVARSNRYKGQRIPGDAHRTIGSEDSHISMKEEKLHRPASPFEADKEAEDLVKPLNALIEQISCFIADSLCDRGSSISSKELEDVLNELICYIGPWLCDKLRNPSVSQPCTTGSTDMYKCAKKWSQPTSGRRHVKVVQPMLSKWVRPERGGGV